MSTSRSILFFSEKKTKTVKAIRQAMKEISEELYPNLKPQIRKQGQYGENAMETYGFSMWFFPNGEDFTYFGGEEVFGNKFEKYNAQYKLWALMGASNAKFIDKDTGEESAYPIYHFRLLMEKLKKAGVENDVLLTCTTNDNKSYPKKIKGQWTGKFL